MPAASFPGVISTICARGLVKSRRAVILRRRGRHSGPASAGHRRHRLGRAGDSADRLHAISAPFAAGGKRRLARAAAPAGFSRCCRTRWPDQQPARRAGAGIPRRGAACRTPWRPVARRAGTSAAIKFIPPALKGCAGWRCGPEAMITRRWWAPGWWLATARVSAW